MADSITEVVGDDEGKSEDLFDVTELRETLSKLAKEKEELEDRYLRKHADFENYRKRMTKEKQDAIQYANTELMRLLLDALDNLERAKEASCNQNASIETVKQGVNLIAQTLYSTLNGRGLSRIEALGTEFDPERHQAISRVEDSSVTKATVVEQYQWGYLLFDRVLRPSMVRVAVPEEEGRDQSGSLESGNEVVLESDNDGE